jgi:hypothetical protein
VSETVNSCVAHTVTSVGTVIVYFIQSFGPPRSNIDRGCSTIPNSVLTRSGGAGNAGFE